MRIWDSDKLLDIFNKATAGLNNFADELLHEIGVDSAMLNDASGPGANKAGKFRSIEEYLEWTLTYFDKNACDARIRIKAVESGGLLFQKTTDIQESIDWANTDNYRLDITSAGAAQFELVKGKKGFLLFYNFSVAKPSLFAQERAEHSPKRRWVDIVKDPDILAHSETESDIPDLHSPTLDEFETEFLQGTMGFRKGPDRYSKINAGEYCHGHAVQIGGSIEAAVLFMKHLAEDITTWAHVFDAEEENVPVTISVSAKIGRDIMDFHVTERADDIKVVMTNACCPNESGDDIRGAVTDNAGDCRTNNSIDDADDEQGELEEPQGSTWGDQQNPDDAEQPARAANNARGELKYDRYGRVKHRRPWGRSGEQSEPGLGWNKGCLGCGLMIVIGIVILMIISALNSG